jgi:TP901 family phage tail tape measure protein
MSLPPAIQEFSVNASAFLAGIDAMLERTDKLTASIDAAAAAADRMSGSFDSAAAADERLAGVEEAITNQTELLLKALEDMSGIMDEGAYAAQRTAKALDKMGASAFRAGESATVAADRAAAAQDRSALAATRAGEAAAVAGDETAAAGEKAALFGGAMKTALLGVGIAAVYGIDKAAKFQSSITQLHTQAGVAQSKLAGLSQGVLQLSTQVGEGPQSLAESLYHVESNMASMGASSKTVLSAVTVAAKGAQVGGANLVDVTNALTAAIASGIPGVQNFQQAMGMLNATVGSGDMHMQDLADAFSTGLLAVVKGYGITLKDTGAALAVFGDNNIRGAKAGTDFRMAVQALAVPVKAGAAQLTALGLSSQSLANDMKSGGLMKALDDLTGKFKKNGITAKDEGEVITTLFGKKAGSGIAVLLEQMDRLKSKYPAISAGADKFAGDWADRQKTMAQQWDDLKSGAQALAISFGTVLLPAATKIVGALAKFGAFLEQHPALAAFAGAILAVAAAFKIAATVAGIFDAVLDANPVMLVVLAVIALVAGLYELYRHFKIVRDVVADVGKFFAGAWHLAMEGAGAVIKWFTAGPLAFIKQQIGVFAQWWHQNSAQILEVTRAVWTVIKDIVTVYWTIMSAEIRVGLAVLKVLWKVTWGQIKDTVALVWNVITAVIRSTIRVVLDIISVALDLMTGKWGKAWSDVQRLVSDYLHGIESILSAFASGALTLLFDAGKNIVQGLINGVKSMIGAVGSVLSDIGHGAVSAFKAVTGIGSPSKVFYSLGGNITTGLALGLRETASQVYAEATALARKVTAAFGAGQITGSEESSLLARISSGLSARSLSLAKIAASIDYAKLGADITARIGSGITETLPQAQAAARRLMAAIRAELARGQISTADADRLTLKIQEDLTSRHDKLVTAMKKIGLEMAAGMLSSLENATSASTAKTAVNKLITMVRQAWSAGDISTSKASAVTKWLEADSTRLQGLATRRQKLLATIKAADAYAAATTSNTEQWAGLSSVASSTTSGGMTYSGNLLAGMQANLASIRQFGAAIKRLAKLGLRKDLLNQIIQMGPEQGLQVANALIEGPAKVIAEMDATQAAIVSGSTSLGQAAANAMYDTGKQAGKGFLSGLQAQEHQVTAMMDRAAKSMVKTLRRELGAGGGGSGGGAAMQVHVAVNGFVGNNAELTEEIRKVLQQEILRYNRRNGKNGLSLTF